MSKEIDNRQTVAMCDVCGRGYMWVAHPERHGRCIDKQCAGHIRMLVTPENNLDDDHWTRDRRIAMLNAGGYVIEGGS